MKSIFVLTLWVSLLFAFAQCHSVSKNTKNMKTPQENFTVTGIAENAKMGAVVIQDGSPYYIDGLESWSADLYKKTVVVTGTLVERGDDTPPPAKGEPQEARAYGNYYVIQKAKWTVK